MKTRSLFETHCMLCAIIMAVIALTFTTCEGPMGPQGESSTPYVGDNGNWWINGVDTGVLAVGVISITKPTKTGYFQYESFASTGLVVQAYFTDGSAVTVNSGYNLYWDDILLIDGNYAISAETGVKTVTVEWQKKVATFEIRVLPPSDNIQVYDIDSWNNALNLIINGGDDESYVIEVIENFGIPGSTSSTFGNVSNVQVMLTGDGKLSLSSQGNLIRIGNNQTVIIDSEDLTLGGRTSNNNSVVYVDSNGTLELRNGTISGNTRSNGEGGGVYVYSGSFTMNGGYISGNSSSEGGGVYVTYGSFSMSGGTISGNTASGTGGGGVYVSYGSFSMSGGTISGNTATPNYGGGVRISYGNFTKSGGGIIYGNNAGANSNTAFGNTLGHAVHYYYFDYPSDYYYYRDTTLGATDDLSTEDTLPASSGQTLNGWTRQ